MKVGLVPKHYSMTLPPHEMAELVIGFRTYCREYHVSDDADQMLQAMEDAYEGDLPQGIGTPIDENGDPA